MAFGSLYEKEALPEKVLDLVVPGSAFYVDKGAESDEVCYLQGGMTDKVAD